MISKRGKMVIKDHLKKVRLDVNMTRDEENGEEGTEEQDEEGAEEQDEEEAEEAEKKRQEKERKIIEDEEDFEAEKWNPDREKIIEAFEEEIVKLSKDLEIKWCAINPGNPTFYMHILSSHLLAYFEDLRKLRKQTKLPLSLKDLSQDSVEAHHKFVFASFLQSRRRVEEDNIKWKKKKKKNT